MDSKKRKYLSLREKCKIVEQIGKGVNACVLAKEYGVAKSTISAINKKKKEILEVNANQIFETEKRKTFKKCKYPRMEEALYNWFVEQRQKNAHVTGDMFKQKAKEIYADIEEKDDGFNASSGWLAGFKSRYGIQLLRGCGEKLFSETQPLELFKQKLDNVIQEQALFKSQIYNADETRLFWKMLPEGTYETSPEKTAPGEKPENARITFLACANATGQHKVQPLVIGCEKAPRSFEFFSIPVDYWQSKNASMTAAIFRVWFYKCFVPQVKQYLQEEGFPTKAILLLNNAPSHLPEDDLRTADGSIVVMYMPPNVTTLIQPMYQNVTRITKLYYRKHLVALAAGKCSIYTFLKKLTLEDAVYLLMFAWNELSASVIKKCWQSILETNDTAESNESDDETDMPLSLLRRILLREKDETVHEIQTLLQAINTNVIYTEDDIENWNSVEDNDPICYEVDIKSPAPSDDYGIYEISKETVRNPITAAEAVNIFDKGIEWAEANTTDFTSILALQRLRDSAVQISLGQHENQTLITHYFHPI